MSKVTLKHLMKQTVDDQARFHNWDYVAVRPQSIPEHYKAPQVVKVDCSDGCRMLCRLDHLDDPAGTDYQPWGNSSSIWAHLPHAPLSHAEIGDMYTFGFGTGEHHVCMAYDVTNKADPEVWNMGTDGQPVFRKLSDEISGHRGMTVTLCKLNLPDTPETPQEKLQAETGFWAWLAWRLGECHWKKYGPKNRKVRPNVPTIIPPAWWKHYARFLLQRKKGNPPTSSKHQRAHR